MIMKFKVTTKFVFNGNFLVNANSRNEAVSIVEDRCHMKYGSITDEECENVEDWCFDVHPDKVIVSARVVKQNFGYDD